MIKTIFWLSKALVLRLAPTTTDILKTLLTLLLSSDEVTSTTAARGFAVLLSDDEILAVFEARNSEILLVPKASGFDALVWVLPVMGFVVGVTALVFAFRRWRLEADAISDPTEADRDLVAAALDADETT